MELTYGDRVKAKKDSTSAIWAEGKTGTIVEVYSRGNYYSNNLVRWDGQSILMGFHKADLIKVS